MPQRRAVIATPTGLHARPASQFAQLAGGSGHEITVAREGEEAVDASSILSVMSLGLAHGDAVILTGDDGSDTILDELSTMLETNLDAVSS